MSNLSVKTTVFCYSVAAFLVTFHYCEFHYCEISLLLKTHALVITIHALVSEWGDTSMLEFLATTSKFFTQNLCPYVIQKFLYQHMKMTSNYY